MGKLVKDALILTVITLVAGLALGLVYQVTKGPIAAAQDKARTTAFQALFADAESFEDYEGFDAQEAKDATAEVSVNGYAVGDVDFNECVVAMDASGTELGKIISVTSHKGYGGDITVVVGITPEEIVGYQITSIAETPGLGMKATEDSFSSQFNGLARGLIEVVKAGPADGQIQAISGATITSNAVTNAIDCAVAYAAVIEGGAQ